MNNTDLLDHWPDEVQKILEFRAIAEAETPEMTALWNEIDNMLADQFISTATLRGVKRWERILKFVPKGDSTLDERRFAILTKLTERLPYTFKMLHAILTELCGEGGYRLTLDRDSYTLTSNLGLPNYNKFQAVASMLRRVVPANMMIVTGVEYNRHSKFNKYRYVDLTAHSHSQLRKEVNI